MIQNPVITGGSQDFFQATKNYIIEHGVKLEPETFWPSTIMEGYVPIEISRSRIYWPDTSRFLNPVYICWFSNVEIV